MKVAPLVHSRTYHNDFLSGFLVRPEYFSSEDIDWARQLIRASTADIDLMQGERYVVLDNGRIRIAGIVIVTEQLAERTETIIDKKYLLDDKGRNVYAFIGFCMKESDIEHHIEVSYHNFMYIFKKYVIPIWEEKVIVTQLVKEDIPISESERTKSTLSEGVKLNNTTIYESNPDLDYQLFLYYLNSKQENFTFCSNITKYATLKNSVFTSLTTNPNNIKRLKIDIPSINQAEKDKEEETYLEFKEKYKNRLRKDLYQELYNEIENQVLSDRAIMEQIIEQNRDKIINDIFSGKITETEHFKIVKLGFLNKKLGFGAHQRPVLIVKKEEF